MISAGSFSDINRINQFNFSKVSPSLSFIFRSESGVFVKVTEIYVLNSTANHMTQVHSIFFILFSFLFTYKKMEIAASSDLQCYAALLNVCTLQEFWSPWLPPPMCKLNTISAIINQVISGLSVPKKSNMCLLAFFTYWRVPEPTAKLYWKRLSWIVITYLQKVANYRHNQ